MTLEFELTGEDYRAYTEASFTWLPERRAEWRRACRAVLSMSTVPIFVVALVVVSGKAEALAYAVLVLLPLVTLIVTWIIVYRRVIHGMIEQSGKPKGDIGLGVHSLVIDAQGISVTTAHVSAHRTWLAVKGVQEGPRHYYVEVLPSGHYIVPKRAFATAAEGAAFRELVERGASGMPIAR